MWKGYKMKPLFDDDSCYTLEAEELYEEFQSLVSSFLQSKVEEYRAVEINCICVDVVEMHLSRFNTQRAMKKRIEKAKSNEN